MSDIRRPTAVRPTRPGQYTRSAMDMARKQKEEESKLQEVMGWVFDRLQTGQYLTANLAQETTELLRGSGDVDYMDAITGAITGKRPGSWRDVLWGTEKGQKGYEFKQGWLEDIETSLPEGKAWTLLPRDVTKADRIKNWTGLVLDVLLDPTTWFGGPISWMKGGKPTTKAASAAKAYAADRMKLYVNSMDLKKIQGLVQKADLNKPIGEALEIWGKRVQKIQDTTRKTHARDIIKHFNQKYNEFLKEGIMGNSQFLSDSLKASIDVLPPEEPLKQLLENAVDPARFQGAGQRAFQTPFGEMGLREAPTSSEKKWHEIMKKFATTKAGKTYADAVWWATERGPVGALKRMIGIRNPYEEMVNTIKRKSELIPEANLHKNINEVINLENILGKDKENVFNLLAEVNDANNRLDLTFNNYLDELKQKFGDGTPAFIAAKNELMKAKPQKMLVQDVLESMDISIDQKSKLMKYFNERDKYLNKINEEDVWAMTTLGKDAYAKLDNYFHHAFQSNQNVFGRPGSGLDIAKHQKVTAKGHIAAARERLKLLYGDVLEVASQNQGRAVDEIADELIKKYGLTDFLMDDIQSLAHRAVVHSKIMGRAKMVEQFKPFGVKIDDIQNNLSYLGNVREIGLNPVQDPALKGYLFDPEIARIVDRVYLGSGTDEGMNMLKNLYRGAMGWWKGMALINPGTQMRNWMSNNVTGYIKHGFDWFNAKEWFGPTVVGTFYALDPNNYRNQLKKTLKVSDAWIDLNLKKRIGNFKVEDLADQALDRGVITTKIYGHEIPKTTEEMLGRTKGKVNPFSKDFVGFKLQQNVMEKLENTSRFQSFLMDYANMQGKSLATDIGDDLAKRVIADDDQLSWAALQSRKWFIDYGDLTEGEKKIRNVFIPFYTWLRKNIANQLNAITMYPSTYSVIPKTIDAMTNDDGYEYELQPEWYKEEGMTPVGRDPETGNWILFRPDFPMTDLNMIPLEFEEGKLIPKVSGKEVMNDILQMSSPLIKLVELIPDEGWLFFERRKIKDYEEAPEVFQFMKKAIPAVNGMANMLGIDDFLYTDEDGRVVMPGKTQRFLTNNLPLLKVLERTYEALEETADLITDNQAEAAVEKALGKVDKYEGLEEWLQTIAFMTGVKMKEIDPKENLKWYEYDVQGRARDIEKDWKRKLPGYRIKQ